MNTETYSERKIDSLRKYVGKQLVSYLRDNDYAHAGGEEAINIVMSYFRKDSDQGILDVGCGLGGTAEYIQKSGWGKLSGFDIESEAITYAKSQYPNINFYTCDVVQANLLIKEQFSVLTLFNVFYAFENQLLALNTLNKLCKTKGIIAIFDYSDPCNNGNTPLTRMGGKSITPFIPVKLSKINEMLKETGWKTVNTVDITNKYELWYKNLIDALHKNKIEVLERFNDYSFNNALKTYTQIYEGITEGVLGGTIIYAKKISDI